MDVRHAYPANRPLAIAIIAVLATVTAVGRLTLVSVLFLRTGRPFEQAVAAERACADRTYVSEREQCMRDWFESARRHAVASK